MRKLIILIAILSAGFLYARQATLSIESDSREGFMERLYDFERIGGDGLELTNTLYAKVSNSDDELERDYKRTYLRDKLRLALYSDNYYISTWFGLQNYSKDDFETRIVGADDQFLLKSSYSGGLDWFGTWNGLETMLEAKFLANYYDRYRYDAATNEMVKDEDYWIDSDGYGKASIAYKFTDWVKPFVEVQHFNDMNDIDTYDYTETRFGNRMLKKVDAVHTVQIELAAVNTDAYENLPWYGEADLRITSKYFHDWMMINRVTEQYWYNEDDSQKAWGNGFYEGILQHNLNFDKDNHIDRFLVAIKTHFNENVTIARMGMMYYFGPFSLYGAYHRYFGSDRMNEYKAGVDLSYYLPRYKTRVYYGFSVIDARYVDDTTVHSLNIEYGF